MSSGEGGQVRQSNKRRKAGCLLKRFLLGQFFTLIQGENHPTLMHPELRNGRVEIEPLQGTDMGRGYAYHPKVLGLRGGGQGAGIWGETAHGQRE